MKKKYTHLFFDLDNTLWDFEKNSSNAMQAAFLHFDIGSRKTSFDTFFEIYSKHNTVLWNNYRNNQIPKKELIRQRFQLTFDELNIGGIDPEPMNSFYLGKMAEQTLLKPGAARILSYLEKKNYFMYIITNGFNEVQQKKLESAGISKFFRKVFVSEEIKTPKPGREIFEYAIKSSNARKSYSLMIGDEWETDIVGASAFGIDSVYINPGGLTSRDRPPENATRREKVYFIKELVELELVL